MEDVTQVASSLGLDTIICESNPTSGGERALESEDGDGLYNGKDLASAMRDVCLYDDYDALSHYRSKDLDRVWSGWDAALIVSKREKAHGAVTEDNYGGSVAEREDVARVIKPEECEIHLGKWKAGETLETEGRDVTIRKVSRLLQPYQKKEEDNHLIVSYFGKGKPKKEYSFDRDLELHEASAIEGEGKMQQRIIAKAVAALTLRVMAYSELRCLEELLSNDAYKDVQKVVYSNVAKFVLSVFDMEDFERIHNHDVVKDECSTFFSNLYPCDCDPLTVVADGRVELDKFSTLREHDLCDILRRYQDFAEDEDLEVQPRFFPLFPVEWDNISESDITSAMTEMGKYVPLKEDCKMQLTLELTRGKSCHILDSLVLEALKDIDIQEFRQFADTPHYEQTHSVEEMVKKQAEEANHLFAYFASCISTAFYTLADDKRDELVYFQKALTFPLSCGKFGPCTDEVIEVIQIADHQRRMQGERYISLQHISFGLSLSRVGDFIESFLSDGVLKCLGGLPSKFSMFGIYKLSRDAANHLGDDKVGLEHLVLAIVFGKQEGDPLGRGTLEERTSLVFDNNVWDAEVLQCLRNSDTKCGVESWEDSNVFAECLPKECQEGSLLICDILLIEEVHRARESGRFKKLAAIRKEKVQHSSTRFGSQICP